MAERPGFMLYFDTGPALSRLTDEEAGQLFKAMLAYAQFGQIPALDGMADFAFELIRPRLDRDAETYRERCETNRYVAYSREAKRRGEVPVDRETWEASTCRNDSLPVVTNCHQQNDNSKPKSALTETEIEKGGMGGKKNSTGFDDLKMNAIAKLQSYKP